MSRPSVVEAGTLRFLGAELEGLAGADGDPRLALLADLVEASAPRAVAVRAIGTTAARAVKGALLAEAIAARGHELVSAEACAGPAELLADGAWQLGVVLSPFKQAVGPLLDLLSPSAAASGVVDTVVRSPVGAIGFNTNTWAALSALEVLGAGEDPGAVLLLGAGASARSVALALTRAWPSCRLVVSARSRQRAAELAGTFGALVYDELAAGERRPEDFGFVVNTTTWGETPDSEAEPFALAGEGLFAPGGRLFDLNNRISALQHEALAAGCAVVSGAVMQRVTNASRAALVALAD